MKKLMSILLCLAMLLPCLGTGVFANTVTSLISGLESDCHYSASLANDGYIGIPVDVCTYYKEGATTEWSPVMLYVMNTNTKRIGTDSDQTIVQSLLDRGFVVVALDYKGNEKAVSPDLDWSIQAIRDTIGKGTHLNGAVCQKSYTYVLPAGYNIVYDDVYWSIDKHASLGSLEAIVDIWNNDFKKAKASAQITLQDGTKVSVADYTANDIYDCVKKDGTPIDLDLAMDIIYPTNPANEVPVMVCISSSETRVGTWTSSKRPHLTGFLFDGYAGVVSDYAYVPMARTDHYGYYDGNGAGGNDYVSGDNYTYSLSVYNGIKSDSAAMRKIRAMADKSAADATDTSGNDTRKFKFNVDKIGVYGNSKGGMCTRLGNPHYETLPEQRYFEGHRGETRLEAIQEDGYADPYINDAQNVTNTDGSKLIDDPEPQPFLTYNDGSTIPSNANFVYANCGGGQETIVEGNAPMYGTGTMDEGGSYYNFYPGVMNACRINDVPFFGLANPGVGHAFGYGMDKDYGIDVYNAFRVYANYWLKDDNAVCEYIDIANTKGASVTDPIVLQFTGSISEEEIKKVTITNNTTNEAAKGVWTPSYGRTQWKFTPHTIKGGYTYTVSVPQTLCAENGKPLAAGKSASFQTKPERLAEAAQLAGSTAISDTNPAYIVFDNADYASSTTVDLRFSVTNDAANTVEIYPVTSLNESNYADSVIGNKLGEIVLTGAGDYEFDVSDYVKSFVGKPAFLLKTKKTPAQTVISDYNFENGAVGSTSYSDVWFSSLAYTTVSDDIKNGSGADNKSAKVNYMIRNSAWIDKNKDLKGNYVQNMTYLGSVNGIKSGNLTADDYGRKFNIGLKVYDTSERLFRVHLTKANSGQVVDWNANTYTFKTQKDNWKAFDFDYRIDEADYWGALQKKSIEFAAETKSVAVLDPHAAVSVSGFAASVGLNGSYTKYANAAAAQAAGAVTSVDSKYTYPLYYDDIVVTEIVTDVQLGTAVGENSIRPSLVLHPADKHNLNAAMETYVENGAMGDTYFGGADAMLVSGRAVAPDSSSEKTYVKLSLENYDGKAASFEFDTKAGSAGTIGVYGVADAAAASGWNSLTIHPLNAPANDRHGNGVDETKVFEGAPLAEVKVKGANTYTVDVTDYAREMKNAGAQSITLILVNQSEPRKAVYTETFEGALQTTFLQGGDPISRGTSADFDHTSGTGASYKFEAAHGYDRLKFDFTEGYDKLTPADVGRTFRVTFWAYIPGEAGQTGQFSIGEIASRTGTMVNSTIKTIPLNTWVKVTHDIVLSENADWETAAQPTYKESGINAFVNIEDIRNGAYASVSNHVPLYIDDIAVEETGLGSAVVVPSDVDEQKTVHINTFDFTGADKYAHFIQSGFNNGTDKVYTTVATQGPDGTDGTSALIQPSAAWNRVKWCCLFDPAGDTWTKPDVGRTFEVTFFAKADKPGSFSYGLMSTFARNMTLNDTSSTYYIADGAKADDKDYASALYGGGGTATIAENDVNQWKRYSYTFTVEDTMLPIDIIRRSSGENLGPQAINRFAIIPDGMVTNAGTDDASIALRSKLYVDDIVVTEILTQEAGKIPYETLQDFENITGDVNSIMVMNGAEYRVRPGGTTEVQIDKGSISTEEFYTGSKSMQLYSTAGWNRFRFKDLMPSLTADDLGQQYRAGFYLKADKPGTFKVGMGQLGSGDNIVQEQTYTIDNTDAWIRYTYDFAVTQDILDGKTMLCIVPNGFGQSNTYHMGDAAAGENPALRYLDAEDPVILYLDDLYIRELSTASGTSLALQDTASICASRPTSTTVLGVSSGAEQAVKSIRKSYLTFTGGNYETTQRAVLTFDVTKAAGQSVKLYGLVNASCPDKLTYNNAPANLEDERMDTGKVFGGREIATLTLDGPGRYSADVTDYVKHNAPQDNIFVLASETPGGTEYMSLDFETFPFTAGLDYTALGGYGGTVSVAGGAAVVDGVTGSGQGISILNAFGSGETCKAGETYVISADVTPQGSDAAYELAIGLSNGKTATAGGSAFTVAAGTTQKITATYTATAADEANGICAVAIYAGGTAPERFTVDNVTVICENTVAVASGANLVVETASENVEPQPAETSKLTVSANGSGRIIYESGTPEEQDWATGMTAEFERGTRLTLTAVADADSKFVYWIDKASGRVVSEEANYSFILGMPRNLEAFFVSTAPGVKTAVFKNKNDKILQATQIDETGSVIVPENPTYMGYSFDKWIRNGIDQTLAANDTIAYKALGDGENLFTARFTKSKESNTVTVVGGTLAPGVVQGQFAYDTKVTVTLDTGAIPAGQKFSHWTKDGDIISYDTVYSFYMGAAPVTVEAVYVAQEVEPVKVPVLAMSNPVVMAGQNKIAFFAERSLETSCTLVETGILLCNEDNPAFDLNTPGVLKGTSISTSNCGQYTVRVNTEPGAVWHARAYMLYIDANGSLKYAFSDVVSATYAE